MTHAPMISPAMLKLVGALVSVMAVALILNSVENQDSGKVCSN